MKIRLDPIVDEPFDWRETLQVPVGELRQPDLLELGDISCRGRVRPLLPGYLLEASLQYQQTLRCTRCLERFELAMESDVSLLIQVEAPSFKAPGAEATDEGDAELELTEGDLGLLRVEEPEIETRPLWVEQVHLGVPMKPLCRDDCAGLCGQCGANLTDGSCDCQPVADPRWAALAGLKKSRGAQ